MNEDIVSPCGNKAFEPTQARHEVHSPLWKWNPLHLSLMVHAPTMHRVYWKEMTRTGVRDDQNVNGLQT